MPVRTKHKYKTILQWVWWVLVVQLVLMNISAAFYAYRFTHFSESQAQVDQSSANVITKTWRLFVGPRFYKQPVSAEPHFPFQPVKLSLSGGQIIDGWYSQQDTAKACVIFLHGITTNRTALLQEAKQFFDWGYNVLLIDFRAHGNSSGENNSFGVKETQEVEAAMQYAAQRKNQQIILYGSSLGAVVAFRAVSEGRVKPDAIIADMPFGSLQDHLKARARVLGFPSQPFGFLVTAWMGIQNGYNGFRHNTCNYAAGVNVPVLLQWGDADPYVLQKETDSIFSCLSSPKKSFVVYQGAGHESFLQSDPVTWKNEVQGFLQSIE